MTNKFTFDGISSAAGIQQMGELESARMINQVDDLLVDSISIKDSSMHGKTFQDNQPIMAETSDLMLDKKKSAADAQSYTNANLEANE